MTGLDDDDFGPDDFRPAPHPDDRLWRHPAEVAAELAAQRAASAVPHPGDTPTVELPEVVIAARERQAGPRRRRLLATAAAGAAAVGVLVYLASDGGGPGDASIAAPFSSTTALTSASTLVVEPTAPSRTSAVAANDPSIIDIAAPSERRIVDQALADRIHDATAASLARVQAATPSGMREGSGFFATDDGHLVTSARLVADSDYLLVWTHDGARWHAELVGIDHFSDVALLRVVAAPAPRATLKPDDDLWAGQYALAVNHTASTMTVGSVASLNDAAPARWPGDDATRLRIEPGMAAGAAIIDDSGLIIGLVNGDHQTRATPAWVVERVMLDLIAGEIAAHPWLGVEITDGAQDDAVISAVIADSPAAAAGLRVDDRIDAVNGTSISASQSLWTLVQRQSPGDLVQLAVTRNGERRLVVVELARLLG